MYLKRYGSPILFLVIFLFSVQANALELPKPSGFVMDTAGVIESVQAQELETLLTKVAQQTGIEIAIVTLPSLDGEQIDDLAVRLFEQWGIGKKGEDNGLLMLAAIQDKRARIEVGYGLEGIIPDAFAGRVLRDGIFPYFKKGEYGNGLIQGARILIAKIEQAKNIRLQDHPPRLAPMQAERKPAGPIAWIFRILLIIGAIILFIKNPFLFFILMSGMGRGGMGGGFGRGGGFGGFGGGLSGGGGASGSW